jgi:AcrR family transcriptional regulator
MTAAAPVPATAVSGRSDARRNREVVLRTAVHLLAEEGLGVSLGRIAQRAGVGAGTVYRHFPTKEILLEAVLAEHLEDLTAASWRWTARAAPADALFGFLLEMIERSAGRQHLCDALTGDKGWPRATLAAAAQRFHQALDRLLGNAQQAGGIRADVRADDLAALAAGGAALCSAHRDRERGLHLVRLQLNGLRAPAVTKGADFRDAPSPQRHETAARGVSCCAECGTGLVIRATGRPARYCGPTCRQRARRRRTAS